jgi:septum formation protein
VREVARTLIRFGRPTVDELGTYATRSEVLELAGAFSVEGRGGPFVESIDGSPSNVLGLSLPHFRLMLAQVGVPIIDLWSMSPSG